MPNRDPYTPPLLIVNVPPVMSSRARAPSLACGSEGKGGSEREKECVSEGERECVSEGERECVSEGVCVW